MNGVLGMARALNQGNLGARQRGQVDMLVKSGEGLMTILNDLLDPSKIEAGKLELETVAFDLHEVAAETVRLWAQAAKDKGLDLALEFPPTVPRYVTGDPTRLRQVLTNLVSNALKFTPDGCVRLSLSGVCTVGDDRVRREGHRHRHDARAEGAGVRTVRPGRGGHRAAVWRHRAGAVDLSAVRHADGRRDHR